MPSPQMLIMTLTTAGLDELWTLQNNGLQGIITHVGLGNTEFTAAADLAVLPGEIQQWPVLDGQQISPTQWNLYAELPYVGPPDTETVRGIGIYLSSGTLLATYAAPAGEVIAYLTESVLLNINHSLVLGAIPADSVTIVNTGYFYNPDIYDQLADHETRITVLEGASGTTVPDATETVKGIVELATPAEAVAGTDTTRAVTPAGLAAAIPDYAVPDATETVKSKVELATVAEAEAGVDTTRAVTPAGVAAAIAAIPVPDATETIKGVVELATTAEAAAGADTVRAVTPAGLAAAVPLATATTPGKVELATNAETQAGTDADRAVTPASLNSRTATPTRTGLVELATNAEVDDGTDTNRAVTPAGLKHRLDGGAKGAVVKRTYVENATASSVSTELALTNAKPQISDGDAILSVSHTPLAIGNFIEVKAIVCVTPIDAGNSAIVALFDGSDDAIDARPVTATNNFSYDEFHHVPLLKRMTITSLSAINYSVRVATESAASPVRINAKSDGSPVLGGALKSYLEITEYQG